MEASDGQTQGQQQDGQQAARPPRKAVEYVVFEEVATRDEAAEGISAAKAHTGPLYRELGRTKAKTKREAIANIVLTETGEKRFDGPFHAVTAQRWDATENPSPRFEPKIDW